MSGSGCCWITALMVFGGAGTDTTQDASTWCNQVMPRVVSHITQSTFLQLGESDTDVEIQKYWCWRSHRWRCRAARRCLCPKPGSSLSDWSLPPLKTKKRINFNEFAPMPSFSTPSSTVSVLPLMLETSMLSLQSFSQVLSMHSWTDCMISRGSSSTHLANTQTHRKHTRACLKPVWNLRQMKFWNFSGCENPECFKFLWKTW